MSDTPKKDLTGIIEFAKELEKQEKDSGKPPSTSPGAAPFMAEVPIEKIDTFESMEEYVQNAPSMPDPSAAVTEEPSVDPFSITPVAEFSTDDPFAAVPDPAPEAPPPEPAPEAIEEPAPPEPTPAAAEDPFAVSASSSESGFEIPNEIETPALPPLEAEAPLPQAPSATAPPPSSRKPPRDHAPPLAAAPPPKPSGNITVKAPQAVPAAFPFSVLIEGMLSDQEKEKLLDLLSRENFGFRELDLEPQLAQGRILLPRISEYAAVLVGQKMRGIQARIKIGPSDSIFATKETQAEADPSTQGYSAGGTFTLTRSEGVHLAEEIPVSADGLHLKTSEYELIDTLMASAVLKSKAVEVETTPDYLDMVENLKRELKFKAFHKGAQAIFHFKVQLDFLSSPSSYRLTAFGSAVKLIPLLRDRENPAHRS